MKISSTKNIKIFLELDESEAKWLKEVMQNPLHGQSPEQEDEDDSMLRMRFFKILAKEI